MDTHNYRQGSIPPPPIGPRGFFTDVKIRPIVVGAVVDYVTTFIAVTLYVIRYYVKESFTDDGIPPQAIEKAFREAMSSQEGLLAFLIIGALCTVLGGYLAGRIAKVEQIKHGALVGAVSLIIGVLQTTMAGAESPVPSDFEFLNYVLAIPAGALGGYLAAAGAGLRKI
jgi:putative membrane protein (TIGR04086 family)